MFRKAMVATVAACLSACAETPPAPHVDAEIIDRAVQHAQAQADAGRRGREVVAVAAIAGELGK